MTTGSSIPPNTTVNVFENIPAEEWTHSFQGGRNGIGVNYPTPTFYLGPVEAGTNANVALCPKGSGALLAALPDGTEVGGNARGLYAVDLQLRRYDAAQVASGTGAVALGSYNTVSGEVAVAIGYQNTVTSWGGCAIGTGITVGGTGSAVVGGNGHTVTGGYGGICGGYGHALSSEYAGVVGGNQHTVSGAAAGVGPGGTRCYALGHYSGVLPGSYYAKASLYGEVVHASGRFATAGDRQSGEVLLSVVTQSANTQAELLMATVSGVPQRFVVPRNGSVLAVRATCLLNRRSVSNCGGSAVLELLVHRAEDLTTVWLTAEVVSWIEMEDRGLSHILPLPFTFVGEGDYLKVTVDTGSRTGEAYWMCRLEYTIVG